MIGNTEIAFRMGCLGEFRMVTTSSEWLRMVPNGYNKLQMVLTGSNWLQQVQTGYITAPTLPEPILKHFTGKDPPNLHTLLN